ncbi:hypothetical protein F5878DRAFT_454164 [Lentinula raphanica]|uniref:Mitochondrial intermembrane space import and assembly protein 40 n=1 Tax=Lentinula raphanica TaxID=153919 RepID=A0AA38UHH9_9AGAR|nr:hypothetical protein F5878DRAFT_454164 [Lentinula raphanica]
MYKMLSRPISNSTTIQRHRSAGIGRIGRNHVSRLKKCVSSKNTCQPSSMFYRLPKAPLSRCLHTQATQSLARARPYRLGFALAASATVVSYSAWRWTREQRIALDSVMVSENTKTPALDGPSSETHHTSPSPSQNTIDSANSSPGQQAQTEAEASDGSSQGAYNPETGEINWDCPCLGGMAYGPCGPEFREAFSCFIYSEEEPKGINCVEKFQAMQNCFRAHPEVYADEIMDDDEGGQTAEGASEEAPAGASSVQDEAASASTPQAEKSSSSVQNPSA